MKKGVLLIAAIFYLAFMLSFTQSVIAEEEIILSDPEGDVLVYDLLDVINNMNTSVKVGLALFGNNLLSISLKFSVYPSVKHKHTSTCNSRHLSIPGSKVVVWAASLLMRVLRRPVFSG